MSRLCHAIINPNASFNRFYFGLVCKDSLTKDWNKGLKEKEGEKEWKKELKEEWSERQKESLKEQEKKRESIKEMQTWKTAREGVSRKKIKIKRRKRRKDKWKGSYKAKRK